jgi:hypothetical protein
MRLTSDQRLAFDVRGYAVVEDALSPQQLAVINGSIDAIEAVWCT